MFGKKTIEPVIEGGRIADFSYLSDSDVYLDSACQSLRPIPVIDALNSYYTTYNACGDRVKYKWGQKVDSKLEAAREAALRFLKASPKDYICSFTLNTSYGINMILSQLPAGVYSQVVTSEVEHNSVFLPTMELAKRLNIPRVVLKRDQDGNLQYSISNLKTAVVVLNAVSNIDARALKNIKEVIKDTHARGGIVIIDGAQAAAHFHDLLANCGADAICFSAHKMYAPSLGVIVISKDLIKQITKHNIGGGMVTTVEKDSYQLLPDEPHTWLEPGLLPYGEIIAFLAAVEWLEQIRPYGQTPKDFINGLANRLFDGLKNIDTIEVFNQSASTAISIYPKKGDAHRLAIFLSGAGIMARSGTFCCHYFLNEVLKTPPLLRLSLGLHNTTADIDKTIDAIAKFTKG